MARQREELDYEDVGEATKRREEATASSAYKIPEGFSRFKVERAGQVAFDILPYRVGEGNPYAAQGKLYYERSYYVHRYIGPEEKDVCCLLRNWKEPCPACEDAAEFKRRLSRDDEIGYKAYQAMCAKDRQLFAVLDRSVAKPEIQIFEYSFPLFGEALQTKLQAASERNGYNRFFRLSGGMTVVANFTKETGGGKFPFYKCKNIELEPRDKDLPASLVDDVPCLDDMLIRLTYKGIRKMLTGGAEDNGHKAYSLPDRAPADERPKRNGRDEPPDDEPARPTRRGKQEEPPDEAPPRKAKGEESRTVPDVSAGDKVKHRKYGRCEVVRVHDDDTLTLADEDGNKYRPVPIKDVSVVEDEPEKPAKGGKARTESDDDWEPEDPPEEPAPRKRK